MLTPSQKHSQSALHSVRPCRGWHPRHGRSEAPPICFRPSCTKMRILLENLRGNGENAFLWRVASAWASASTTHRQTEWGLQQCGWSDDACATLQRRPRHELAWIWTDFLSEQCRATEGVGRGRAGRRAGGKRKLHDISARLRISSQYLPWQRTCYTVA